ncbi:MAG TPA: trehalose-6-phosphate synthase [Acidisphaera sp.]|nr:trehalose-6-phosphate synthase [Acidisphaera sp.]
MNRLVVVSNRVPEPDGAGNQAGGLAVALGGLMQKRGGVWFGWSGKVMPHAADRPATIEHDGEVVRATIDLTRDEHDRYYSNFSNGVLWPLLHTMPEAMQFDRRDAHVYRDVNARFADSLVPLLRPSDLIWVHDYHLLALPALLRSRGVLNPIGFFLHIPFPSPDVLSAVPDAAGLVGDLLAADLIGFQTERDVANFKATAVAIADATPSPTDATWLTVGNRRVRLGVFPAEIEAAEFAATAAASATAPATERLRRSLQDQKLILGVDRLDPTKGLLQRLAGYRRLLETRHTWRRQVTFLQIAAVSRKDVESYRDLRVALNHEVGAINGDFGDPDWTPLRFVGRSVPRHTMAGYMRIARVGLVTPLRDGMNLVAKEFVAAQDPDDPGVLVLSRFAGAAHQLDAAVLVNPNDTDDMTDALDRALRMDRAERRARQAELWAAIAEASPMHWGRAFLAALLRTVIASPAPITVRTRRPTELTLVSSVPPAVTDELPDTRQMN